MNGLKTISVGDDRAGFKSSLHKGGDLLAAQDNMTFHPAEPQI
jgi:hypothetical protein